MKNQDTIRKIKAGDSVYVTIVYNDRCFLCKYIYPEKSIVRGFFEGHIAFKDGTHHFLNSCNYVQGLFYGFGYYDNCVVIITKNKWTFYLALLVEKIKQQYYAIKKVIKIINRILSTFTRFKS